jgi:DNA-binding response OmpR family regulator
MARLLLVEDDERVAGAVGHALRRHGHEVERVATGADALTATRPDLVLLDLGLPDVDGLELCDRLRARDDLPIIGVTARGNPVERVTGLRRGLDDYVVKPFSIAELTARIDAVLRRTERATERQGALVAGPVRVDPDAHSVTVDDREITLSRLEFDLLVHLVRRPGIAVSRRELLAEVWCIDGTTRSRTVDVHVGSLRHKLDVPDLIQTVHGVGYRLVVPE